MYKNKIDYFRIKDWIKKAEYNIYIFTVFVLHRLTILSGYTTKSSLIRADHIEFR